MTSQASLEDQGQPRPPAESPPAACPDWPGSEALSPTGEFLRQSTHQGWRDDSSWARGLCLALYGFCAVYGFTRDPRFLATAQACADFYIERTPAHGVPPNDWDEPRKGEAPSDAGAPALPYESSAAAIASPSAPGSKPPFKFKRESASILRLLKENECSPPPPTP